MRWLLKNNYCSRFSLRRRRRWRRRREEYLLSFSWWLSSIEVKFVKHHSISSFCFPLLVPLLKRRECVRHATWRFFYKNLDCLSSSASFLSHSRVPLIIMCVCVLFDQRKVKVYLSSVIITWVQETSFGRSKEAHKSWYWVTGQVVTLKPPLNETIQLLDCSRGTRVWSVGNYHVNCNRSTIFSRV